MVYKFYDTESLITTGAAAFSNPNEQVIICNCVLHELTKRDCKEILHLLDTNRNWENCDTDYTIPDNNTKVFAAAVKFDRVTRPDEVVFVTSDFYLYNFANRFFGKDSIVYLEANQNETAIITMEK